MPCGPINDLAEVFADPQVRRRGMTVELAASARRRGAAGRQPDQALGDAGRATDRAPPLLGADTDEVLAEFGLDAAAIAALRRAGAI